MKLAQRKIKWLARLMLGLVLFAQGVVAANACIAPNAGPTQAYVIGQNDNGTQRTDEAAPCHEEEIPNANACLTHCTQSDQISADQQPVWAAAPITVASLQVPVAQDRHNRLTEVPERLVLNTGPPLTILFCSFLN